MSTQYLQNYLKNISSNIKEVLEVQSMSILELSNKTKISYSSLYNLVNEKQNPTLETLLAICEILGVELSQLVGEASLFRMHNSICIKEIPVIDWNNIDEYLKEPQPNNFYKNKIIISCNTTIKDSCFALHSQQSKYFLNNSTLLFEKTTSNPLLNVDRIVLLLSNKQPATLKKLLLDGETAFLESIDQTLPIRELSNNERIVAWLFQIRTDF
jgi:transcriptional regulator with XRE-family HTH domain